MLSNKEKETEYNDNNNNNTILGGRFDILKLMEKIKKFYTNIEIIEDKIFSKDPYSANKNFFLNIIQEIYKNNIDINIVLFKNKVK